MKMITTPIICVLLFGSLNVSSQRQPNNSNQLDPYDESQYRTVVKFLEIMPNIKMKIPDDGFPRQEIGDPLGYYFSVTGYYSSGEPAFVYKKFCTDRETKNCTRSGKEVWYYKNGNIRKEGINESGGYQGYVTLYNENGSVLRKELYQGGKPIVENKFPIPEDCPLIGTWKLAAYYQPNDSRRQRLQDASVLIFYKNSINETTTRNSLGMTTTEYANWSYISQSPGLVEYSEYHGADMIAKGAIRWVNRNEFEFTFSFSQDPSFLGMTFVFTRK